MYPRSFRSALALLMGVSVSVCAAALLSLLLYDHRLKTTAPIVFLCVVVLVSVRWGMLAGFLGAAISAMVFATFLFQPIGSLQVADKTARANLAWLVLGGLVLPYLLAPENTRRTGPPRQ